MSPAAHYDRSDLAAAFESVGLRDGDVVFSHTSVAMLGIPDAPLEPGPVAELYRSALFDVIGSAGTWVLPTYTYSYTKGERFDPASTPPTTDMGAIPEALWRDPGAVRSLDPIFSVIAIGPQAGALTAGIPKTCFGPDSVYARLIEADAVMCNVGIGAHSALLHHVEQERGVDYRFIKEFGGLTVVDGEDRETTIGYNVRALDNPRHGAYFLRLDRDGRADGSVRAARAGRGEVNAVRARDMKRLADDGLDRDPEYLVLGDLAETTEAHAPPAPEPDDPPTNL